MFESITKFFKRFKKSEKEESKSTAKERLHLVLAQDRANISADFLEMMKQEILEVIKKYIDIDEKAIDVRLTNKEGEDGSIGAPALYANIPIITIKNEARKLEGSLKQEDLAKSKEEQKQDAEAERITSQEEQGGKQENEVQPEENEKDDSEEENIKKEETTVKQENREENIEEKQENANVQDGDEESNKNKVNEVENEEKNS